MSYTEQLKSELLFFISAHCGEVLTPSLVDKLVKEIAESIAERDGLLHK